ncbi:MAG: hypothetical protein H6595_10950 [Flavobacteriales bacterium]|nr:hypothetical protein [Flavobacteriales bacterium]
MRSIHRRVILVGAATVATCTLHAQLHMFEGDTTPSWAATIAQYQELADRHPRTAKLTEIGRDDDGSRIHLFIISDVGTFKPREVREQDRNVLFILNGIHPGEPDGVNASLMLAQGLLESDQLMGLLATTTVAIVPIYNVSGARQRSASTRVDQNGPVVCGFRGNARDLDLNRDMVKMDSRNAMALVQALRSWDPDVFIDTHVSDGADHRYLMELLTTQKDKLDPDVSAFMTRTLVPELYAWMERKKVLMCPYFELRRQVPDSGLVGFLDGPRYTTGYTALFNTIGIMAESHMRKPFADRVNATYQLLLATLAVLDQHGRELRDARQRAEARTRSIQRRPVRWTLDTTVVQKEEFLGYRSEMRRSAVSGLPRLFYDGSRPVDLTVDRYDHYVPALVIDRPKAYLVPQAWREVMQRLALNGVEMERLNNDTSFVAEMYRIGEMRTTSSPYEGHYLHSDVEVGVERDTVQAHAGDMLVPMGHATDRYVMEVLEPQSDDGLFAWGFFDSILQQKEWFNDYSFEEKAAELLAADPELAEALERKREADPGFAADGWAHLAFVFRRSPYMEPNYRRYPIARLLP